MADTGNVLEALQALSNKDLGRLLRELTIYAEIRLNKLGFVPKTEVDSVSGEDFAQEAFKLTIEGKRTWPIKEHPDLAEFLRMVVFSLIRNHFKKSGRAPVNIRDLNAVQIDDSDNVGTEFIDFTSPDEVLITVEQWQRIEMAFGDDMDGFIFFTDWLDDLPPREIAEKYSEEVTVIYRKIKKGKGIITKIFSS
jgi:DNA-directed RNA polymerase specialized sigma24 family protein